MGGRLLLLPHLLDNRCGVSSVKGGEGAGVADCALSRPQICMCVKAIFEPWWKFIYEGSAILDFLQ